MIQILREYRSRSTVLILEKNCPDGDAEPWRQFTLKTIRLNRFGSEKAASEAYEAALAAEREKNIKREKPPAEAKKPGRKKKSDTTSPQGALQAEE